jgi:hypothetical protein
MRNKKTNQYSGLFNSVINAQRVKKLKRKIKSKRKRKRILRQSEE